MIDEMSWTFILRTVFEQNFSLTMVPAEQECDLKGV